MPTINLEMMKQLLQEFSEKEALTTEEINLIEQEISTLEQRVSFCRGRLQNLGADKEKLLGMKERYVNGHFPQPPRVPFSAKVDEPMSHFNPPPSLPEANVSHNPVKRPADVTKAQLDSVDTLEPAAISQQAEVMESNHPFNEHLGDQVQNEHPQDQPTADNDNSGKENAEGGEHVKSINDALKGLFRSPGQNKK